MQKFRIIPETERMSDSLDAINNNATSLRTNFSGEDFPEDIEVGQTYYQPVPGGKGKIYYCYTKDGDTAENCFVLAIDLDTGVASNTSFSAHVNNASNPHKVTASQVGTYDKASLDKTFATLAKKDLTNVDISSYPVFRGATASANGTPGILPAINKADYNKFLRGDGTFQYIKTGFDAFPIGYRMSWDGDIVPEGWVEEKGQILNRADYPDGWQFAVSYGMVVTDIDWINKHLKGKFSSGDGTTTFRMPDRRGMYDLYRDTDIGKYIEPGLPDHTHNFTVGNYPMEGGKHWHWIGEDGTAGTRTTKPASVSNSIYGKSDTVTPPSIVTRSIRKMK